MPQRWCNLFPRQDQDRCKYSITAPERRLVYSLLYQPPPTSELEKSENEVRTPDRSRGTNHRVDDGNEAAAAACLRPRARVTVEEGKTVEGRCVIFYRLEVAERKTEDGMDWRRLCVIAP